MLHSGGVDHDTILVLLTSCMSITFIIFSLVLSEDIIKSEVSTNTSYIPAEIYLITNYTMPIYATLKVTFIRSF